MGIIDKAADEIEKKRDEKDFGAFIKTVKPSPLDPKQKVALNRRGNELLNAGDTEGAKKIFSATSYGDGLARVGKVYEDNGRPLDALKEYAEAKNERGLGRLCESAATVVSAVIKES